MTEEDLWPTAVTRLSRVPSIGLLNIVLDSCSAELQDGTVVVKVPEEFYAKELRRKQDGIEVIKQLYGASHVRFVQDEEAKKRFKEGFPEKAKELADKITIPAEPKQKPKRTPTYRTKYFDIGDNLSRIYHPKESEFLKQPTNSRAYQALESMVQAFPDSPNVMPVMITARVGMGKTHLLQHFAWQIHDMIIEAREALKADDLDRARALLKAGQDVPEKAVREKLERAAKSRCRYVTGELFADEYLKATNKAAWENLEGKSDEYKWERRSWYDSVQWLLWDDIHALARGEKKATLEDGYRIINPFHEKQRFMLVTATDTSPTKLIKDAIDKVRNDVERFVSRCYSGRTIKFKPSTPQELVDVVNHYLRAQDEGVKLITVEDMKKVPFFNTAKSYRDARSIAQNTHEHLSDGQPLGRAVMNGIQDLIEERG